MHSVWDSSIARKLNGLPFDAHAVAEKPAAVIWARELAGRVRAQEQLASESSSSWGLSSTSPASPNPSSHSDTDPNFLANECTDLANPNKCGIEWATEANSLVCKYVLAPGLDWVKENDLGRGEYYEGAAPVVELQVARAGVRLAAWVNAIAAVVVDGDDDATEKGVGKEDL